MTGVVTNQIDIYMYIMITIETETHTIVPIIIGTATVETVRILAWTIRAQKYATGEVMDITSPIKCGFWNARGWDKDKTSDNNYIREKCVNLKSPDILWIAEHTY